MLQEVVYSPELLLVVIRIGLKGVNKIREFHSVSNKEYRNIIPDKVPVSLPGIELNRKPSNIPHSFRGSSLVDNSGEP